MADVEKSFGEPTTRHPAVGGGSPRQPPITRWDYPGFTVVFEHDKVVDAIIPGAPPRLTTRKGLQPVPVPPTTPSVSYEPAAETPVADAPAPEQAPEQAQEQVPAEVPAYAPADAPAEVPYETPALASEPPAEAPAEEESGDGASMDTEAGKAASGTAEEEAPAESSDEPQPLP